MFVPSFGSLDCREIRTFHIEDFFNTLTGSDKTKKNVMVMLKNFCHWLQDRDIMIRLPKFPDISPEQPVIIWTTKEVQLKILAAVPEKDRGIFQFAVYHPIRPGELRALRVKDFLKDQGLVQISRAFSLKEERSRKNKKPYYLPLSATFDHGILKGKLPEAFVFLNAIGRPYTASGLRKVWQRACAKAKVPYINFYNATRHSIASQALNAGVSLDRISQALGHSNLEITRRYASLNVQKLLDVVDGIGQLSDKQKMREIIPRISGGLMERATGYIPVCRLSSDPAGRAPGAPGERFFEGSRTGTDQPGILPQRRAVQEEQEALLSAPVCHVRPRDTQGKVARGFCVPERHRKAVHGIRAAEGVAESLRQGQGALYQLLQRHAPFHSVSGTQCRSIPGPYLPSARTQQP
jgi:integrase